MATAEPITHHCESKGVTRRSIFAAMPAAGALIAAPALAGEDATHTPVAQLFRKWREAFAAVQTDILPVDRSDEEMLRLLAPLDRCDREIMKTPATTPADFLMKLAAHTEYGIHDLSCCPGENALIAEMKTLLGGMFA